MMRLLFDTFTFVRLERSHRSTTTFHNHIHERLRAHHIPRTHKRGQRRPGGGASLTGILVIRSGFTSLNDGYGQVGP